MHCSQAMAFWAVLLAGVSGGLYMHSTPFLSSFAYYDHDSLPGFLTAERIAHRTERFKNPLQLYTGIVHGSETVQVHPGTGELIMLDKTGGVWIAASAESPPAMRFYVGPGRPLGFALMPDDGTQLIICNSLTGLLSLNLTSGHLEVLSNRVSDASSKWPGRRLNYANDLAIASDGTVYFTLSTHVVPPQKPGPADSTAYYDTMEAYMLTMYSGRRSGALARWDPIRGTHVLADGLLFPNGVALTPDGDCVAVVETVPGRVLCYDTETGRMRVLADRLPGFPDGVTVDPADGSLYVAMVAPPNPMAALLRLRWLRALLASCTTLRRWVVKVGRAGTVVQLSSSGALLRSITDSGGVVVSGVSGVTVHGGQLLLGSLLGEGIAVVDK